MDIFLDKKNFFGEVFTQRLLEQSTNSIVITNKEGNIVYVNPIFTQTTGYTLNEVIGKNPKVLKSNVQNHEFYSNLWQTISNGKIWKGEFCNIKKNKERYWEAASISPIIDEFGNITHYLAIKEDITEKKQLQINLKESQSLLKHALNYAKLAYWDIDVFNEETLFSEEFYNLLQINPEKDFDIERFFVYLEEDCKIDLKIKLQEILHHKINDFSLKIQIKKSENLNYFKLDAFYLMSENSNDKIFIIFQDITDLIKNEELQKKIEVTAHISKLKQQFISNMGHELRTPLNSVFIMLDFLEKTEINEEQSEYITTIKNSSEILLHLINDVLDISRIESGKMEVKNTVFNISHLFDKIKQLHEINASQKNIALEFYFESHIPEFIKTDEKKILQVLSNLTSNAIKFTEQGKISIYTNLISKNNGKLKFKIEIIDTGIGIKFEELKKLFNLFEQIEKSNNRSHGGAGLGLMISKEIVGLLNGEIGVDSDYGKGSKFWFTFIAEEVITTSLVKSKTPEFIQKKLVGINILLAEDIEVNQKIIKMMLEKTGCNVSIANNGKELIEKYAESQISVFNIFHKEMYDMILLDIQMPIMDGLQALIELKHKYKNLPPIIGLSANALESDAEYYISQGMDDYISKPIKSEILFEKIVRNIEKHRKIKTIKHMDELEAQLNKKFDEFPLVNQSTIDTIFAQSNYDKEFIKSLFESFIDDVNESIIMIDKSIQTLDYAELKNVIHSIKGLSGTLGATQFHEVCKQIDILLKEDNKKPAINYIPVMKECYTHLLEHIKANYL